MKRKPPSSPIVIMAQIFLEQSRKEAGALRSAVISLRRRCPALTKEQFKGLMAQAVAFERHAKFILSHYEKTLRTDGGRMCESWIFTKTLGEIAERSLTGIDMLFALSQSGIFGLASRKLRKGEPDSDEMRHDLREIIRRFSCALDPLIRVKHSVKAHS